MGWAAYIYMRIHSNNQKDLDKYVKSNFEFILGNSNITKAMRYDTYIYLSFYHPDRSKQTLEAECCAVVETYKSFVIDVHWNEELNDDTGAYLVKWSDNNLIKKEISYYHKCAEEKGEFNSKSKTLKKAYHSIDYDINLKNKIYTSFGLDKTHIGVYSYIIITLKILNENSIYEYLEIPESCIRWHYNLGYDSQVLVWTPKPLREMMSEKFTDIVCEWWSADGKRGGRWVKKPKSDWRHPSPYEDFIDIDYPAPYIPCFGKDGTLIPI